MWTNHENSHDQQARRCAQGDRPSPPGNPTASGAAPRTVVADAARSPGAVRRSGTSRPSRLCADGRPDGRRPVGSSDAAGRLHRGGKKKVIGQSPLQLRSGETRPLLVRLLGGMMLYVATLYCGPAARTGQGRGREGAGLYPELAVLGLQEGKRPALVRAVGRQTALLPSYEMARQELAERGLDLNIK